MDWFCEYLWSCRENSIRTVIMGRIVVYPLNPPSLAVLNLIHITPGQSCLGQQILRNCEGQQNIFSTTRVHLTNDVALCDAPTQPWEFLSSTHGYGFPCCTEVKNMPASIEYTRDVGSICGPGRFPEVGSVNLLQYSCLRQLTGEVSDVGKIWGQKEKRASEDEMAQWHHQYNEHELGQTTGDGEAQRGWHFAVHRVAHMTQQLGNNN